MRYISLIFVFFFTCTSIKTYAAGSEMSQDSLIKRCEESRALSRYDDMEKYSSQLITLSQNKNNIHNQTYAYFYNGLANLFLGNVEESQSMLKKAETLANHIGNDSVKALVYNSMGIYHAMVKSNNLLAKQFFLKSLQLSKKAGYEELQYRVMANMLNLSHLVGGKHVLENAQMVYKYGVKNNNYEQISLGAYYLASYYLNQNNFRETEKYLKITLDTYNKCPQEDIAVIYLLYAKMELTRGNLDTAEEMVNKATTSAQNNNQPSILVDAFITNAELKEKHKDYNGAIALVNTAMKQAQEAGITSKDIAFNNILARCYSKLGNTSETIKYLQKANSLLEDQPSVNMERLSYEIDIIHEMEQKDMESHIKQEKIASQRLFLIMMGILMIVLVILLIFIINSYARRQKLYKMIVKQNTKAIAQQEIMQKQIEQLIKDKEAIITQQSEKENTDKSAHDAASIDDDKIDLLYAKLCSLMNNDRLFTEPQLTREKMAERLGTNRTYLTRVIKEKCNMTYLQFINSYRINEAIKILSDKEKVNYPLKQIWSDLGFSSPSTFFKIFQQTVGITPATFRKQFLEVNKEEHEEYFIHPG